MQLPLYAQGKSLRTIRAAALTSAASIGDDYMLDPTVPRTQTARYIVRRTVSTRQDVPANTPQNPHRARRHEPLSNHPDTRPSGLARVSARTPTHALTLTPPTMGRRRRSHPIADRGRRRQT